MSNNAFNGAQYLSKGFSLMIKPGIRAFVIVPLLINLILLAAATIYAFNLIGEWFTSLEQSEYGWVQWITTNLDWLLWPIIVLSVLLVVLFLFAFLANWVAAPFNGLLAEAVEKHLSGDKFQVENFSWKQFFADIPRLFAREWRKLLHFLPRALGCLAIFLLTFWNPLFFLAPILWFVFNCWMTAVQYIDYPMDNHRVPFNTMLAEIRARRSGSIGFGAIVTLVTMIPLLNLVVMPAAVAGATNLWFDHYRD